MLESKLSTGTSRTKRLHQDKFSFSLLWMSQCVTCSPASRILYHVTARCKGPINPCSVVNWKILMFTVWCFLIEHFYANNYLVEQTFENAADYLDTLRQRSDLWRRESQKKRETLTKSVLGNWYARACALTVQFRWIDSGCLEFLKDDTFATLLYPGYTLKKRWSKLRLLLLLLTQSTGRESLWLKYWPLVSSETQNAI